MVTAHRSSRVSLLHSAVPRDPRPLPPPPLLPLNRSTLSRIVFAIAAFSSNGHAQQRTALGAVQELLDADRAFAAAAEQRSVVDALMPMFAPEVSMQTPSGFVNGRDSVLAALHRNRANIAGRVRWTPVRGGVSADGTHGFTFGYMTLERADTAAVQLKYMSYWVRGASGWRVVAYKRGVSPSGTPEIRELAPSLPVTWHATLTNAATAARDLADAERAFSVLASEVGLREAFRRTGAPDAVNMGGGRSPSFVVGPDAIGAGVGEGEPPGGSALSWGSDRVIVAPSGDLGVSIGTIVAPGRNAGDAKLRIPFFTIWRRDSATEPWRYIAE